MINLYPYPNNIGTILKPKAYDKNSKPNIYNKKAIIRLFGIAGSGKGTLAKQLCSYLDIAYLETSYILRSATWIYKNLGLDNTKENTDKVFDQIEITLPKKSLEFYWNGQKLTDAEIRSNLVQQNVAIYSGDPYFRSKYYQKINHILSNLTTGPVILDGRGSSTPYLQQAKKDGFKVIRTFLWSSDEVNYERYKSSYLDRNNLKLKNLTKEQEEVIKQEFKKNIFDRNQKDYQNAIDNNLGTITPDTGIIDTSNLTPEQVMDICLHWIEKNLDL